MYNKVNLDNLQINFINQLENCDFFKLDCNLFKNTFKKGYLYGYLGTISGFSAIDIYAKEDLINGTNEGINDALNNLNNYQTKIESRPLLIISKKISSLCNDLDRLVSIFNYFSKLNFDILEFHIDIDNSELIKKILKLAINVFPNKNISFNISRKIFSNTKMIEFIRCAYLIMKNKFIIEVDGLSNNDKRYNNFNDSIQAISTADIINKQLKYSDKKFSNFPIILTGGINNKTIKLAEQCGVIINGITINIDQIKILKNFQFEELKDLEKMKHIVNLIKNYNKLN